MTNKEIRKSVEEKINEGKTQQQVFDEIKETSGIEPDKLAKIVSSIPTVEIRRRNKIMNIVLIVLLSITVLDKMLAGIPIVLQNGIAWLPVIFLLPIINVVLLWMIVKSKPFAHRLVALFSFLGLLRAMPTLMDKNVSPFIFIELAIVIGIIVISLLLHMKMYAGYKKIKEKYKNENGQIRVRTIIKFND